MVDKYSIEEIKFDDGTKAYRIIDNSNTRIICTCRHADDATTIYKALNQYDTNSKN